MPEGQGWGGDFAELRRRLDRAHDASHHLADWVRAQLGSADLPTDIVTIVEEISKTQSLVNQLSDRLYSGPFGLLLHGHPMSREAYCLLVASGVLWFEGSYTGDPYDDFQMLRYEDDKRRGYICVDEASPPGSIKLHGGMRPEEISWERLRPEQRDFFGRHLPEIAVRFKREA